MMGKAARRAGVGWDGSDAEASSELAESPPCLRLRGGHTKKGAEGNQGY